MLIALFLSGMRYGTYVYVLLLNIGGALSMFSGASSAIRGIRVKTCQEIQSSLLERSCVLLPRVTWIEFSACFKG